MENKTNRGRKPQPEGKEKKQIRYIKCPNCQDCFEYDYKNPEFRRPHRVDPTLTPRSKTREYNKIYREKAKLKNKTDNKPECRLE